jgi:hypothetical protein
MIAPVRAVVEDQKIPVGQRTRVVLLGERWAAEPPDDLARGPVDHDDGRDVAEAHDDVALRRLGHRVAVRPLRPAVLERHRMGRGVEVIPASPLPHDLAARRHLDEVVGVHRAARLGARQSTLDAAGEIGGQRPQAEQEDVAVAEPARVVVMIRMPDLPDDAPVPVHLEDRAALEARPSLEALEVFHDLAAVEQMPVGEQMAVEARSMRQAPGVRDLAVHVHEVDGTVAVHRREQRVARLGARGIVGDEPGPRSPDLLLIHRAHTRHDPGALILGQEA